MPTQPSAAAGACPVQGFEFHRDTFAFANELLWEYRFEPDSGQMTFARRVPAPTYAHRCFVIARSARQFLYHARFEPGDAAFADAEGYRRGVKEVVARNPREACASQDRIVIPGYAGLREFSRAHEALLKSTCGGAWQSYVLRSHWRMVFPISRAHQERTMQSLVAEIEAGRWPIVHLVRFPKITINHGMVLFGVERDGAVVRFAAYDPNDPQQPTVIEFDREGRIFSLAANRYWAGGTLNVIEIYRGWLM